MMVLVMLRNSGNKIDEVNGMLLFQLYFSMFRFDCLLSVVVVHFQFLFVRNRFRYFKRFESLSNTV